MENKTTSVTTHFKKLTTGNNVFSVLVIVCNVTVTFCSFYIKCLMCPHCCLTSDDALNQVMPLTNGVINETLRQFAPLSDISQGSVATHLKCGRMFSNCVIANCLVILTVKQRSVNVL